MSQITNPHSFVDGETVTATVMNSVVNTIIDGSNDNYARITAIDAVVNQAGFTPSSAYSYFQTNFSNANALYWMGGF